MIPQPTHRLLDNFFNRPAYRILLHLLFWTVFYSDEILSAFGVTDPLVVPFTQYFIEQIPVVAVVYLNLYLLVPRLLLERRIWQYVLAAAAATIAGILGMRGIHEAFPQCVTCEQYNAITNWLVDLLNIGFLMGTTTAIVLLKAWFRDQTRIQKLENEQLKSELEYLKSQVNPHFLFNTLNNIYVLSKTDPELGSRTLLDLSDLLRYVLYDCDKEQVPLAKEIESLRTFLNLDGIRKTNPQIAFEVKGKADGILVPPLLFLPFVENAVKHGGTAEGKPSVDIFFDLQPNRIDFRIRNPKAIPPNHVEPGGIGLPNLKRRLALLFPEQHLLEIRDEETEFSVELRLDL